MTEYEIARQYEEWLNLPDWVYFVFVFGLPSLIVGGALS